LTGFEKGWVGKPVKADSENRSSKYKQKLLNLDDLGENSFVLRFRRWTQILKNRIQICFNL